MSLHDIDTILGDAERELQVLYKETIAAPSIPIEAEPARQWKSNIIAPQNVSLAALVLDMYWEVRPRKHKLVINLNLERAARHDVVGLK